jgi:ABA DEFICIENT 4-like
MTPDRLFSIANTIALAAWITMIVLRRRSWVLNTLIGRVVPAVFAAIYIAILAGAWADSTGGFSSLAGVAALFSNRWLLLAGWLHYLAFDLADRPVGARRCASTRYRARAGSAVPVAYIHVRTCRLASLYHRPAQRVFSRSAFARCLNS